MSHATFFESQPLASATTDIPYKPSISRKNEPSTLVQLSQSSLKPAIATGNSTYAFQSLNTLTALLGEFVS